MTIRNRVGKLTRGCNCKKNMCATKQCGCRQKGLTCGPGCQCIHCNNVLQSTPCSEPLDTAEAQNILHFNNEIEQTLLIGEEIEVGNNSDSDDGNSDCNDSDSDTDYSTDDIT